MEKKLKLRSAAVIKKDNKVLLHKIAGDTFWNAPDGKIEFYENAQECIIRELKEELGWDISELNYLGIVENFFTFNQVEYKEIIFYFDILKYIGEDFQKKEYIEDAKTYLFKYFSLDELKNTNIKPNFFNQIVTYQVFFPFYLTNYDN
jgi:8-oxo-dGTP pyrophosphatase MutT (NUDIX family)